MNVRRLSPAVVAVAGTVLVSGGCASGRGTAPEAERPGYVRIRGTASVSMKNDPLVVVDGRVRRGRALRRIMERGDFESVEVIRALAAIERYGCAARHGAVVIQTTRPVAPPR